MYDFKMAQPVIREKSRSKFRAGVDIFIANSENVKSRIEKFYRRDSVVIYPPVDVERIRSQTSEVGSQREEYFLIVARLVGAKGLEESVKAFSRRSKSHPKDGQLLADKYKLKIVGEAHGFSDVQSKISKVKSANIEFLGRVSDEKLWELYAKAKGFIALSRDEDFGMTPVEAQAAGTPVIAFNGGGYKESVLPGVTGLLINDTDEKTITEAIERFEKIKWDKKKLQENAMRFSKERFEKEIRKIVESIMN
jgi:glycosyltransferase involved in cell wall biosynthesis